MCDVATQKSFVSPNHLPLQEPLIANNPIQRVDAPQQSAQSPQIQDGVDTTQQGPTLGRVSPQTGVEGAFAHPANQQIARVAEAALAEGLILLPGGDFGHVLELTPPVTLTDEQVEFAIRTIGDVVERTP